MNWLTLLILFIVNAVLIAVGAAVFKSLERNNSVVELRNIITQRTKFFDKYKYVDPDDLEKLLILYSSVSKYGRILSEPVGYYNYTVHDSSTESTRDSTRDSTSDSTRDSNRDSTRDSFRDSIDDEEFDSKWDFSRSCLFTLTVISTIGYGSMSPVTTEGRMFCVVFAIFGIPLFMALIAGCGENIREFIATRTLQRSTSKRLQYMLMFLLTLVCVFLFVVLPAILFQRIEDWPYSDSIYYTIISITTIGFGDLVPNGNMDMAGAVLVAYRVFHFAWLLLGLAWLSTVINSRQAVVVKFFNKHAERLDPWCAMKDSQSGDTTADINSPTNPGDTTADVNPSTNKRPSENDVLEVGRK